MTLPIAALIGFALGLLLGSFLNVCISRVPRGQSIIHPGSHCPVCNHPIRWFDNIPLLSWLILRGKCRDCKTRIPWRYPAVELASGLWIALSAARFQTAFSSLTGDLSTSSTLIGMVGAIAITIFGLLLIALIVIDWQTHRLPDAFTLPGIATGLFLVCVQAVFLPPGQDQIVLNTTRKLRLSSPGSFDSQGNVFLTGPENLVFGRIFAVIGAALLLLLIRWLYKKLRHREGLGLGDVKMLAMIAAFLGFWPAILTLFVAVLLASLWAVVLLARRRATSATRLPFGSFLGVAGLFTALFGPGLIAWYTTLLHP